MMVPVYYIPHWVAAMVKCDPGDDNIIKTCYIQWNLFNRNTLVPNDCIQINMIHTVEPH